MSHLAHINNFKKELIESGILEPEIQIAIVRTAYVSALIQLVERHCVSKDDRKDVIHFILSYWNEIFPVNGNLVYSQIVNFYDRLAAELSKGGNVFVQLVTDGDVNEDSSFYDMESYKTLVDTLFDEAQFQYGKSKKI